MIINKYRIHEVGKDFKVSSKDIIKILNDAGFTDEKNHMTALSVEELSYIFDYYTKNNQLENLDEYFIKKSDEKSDIKADDKKPDVNKAEKKEKSKDTVKKSDKKTDVKNETKVENKKTAEEKIERTKVDVVKKVRYVDTHSGEVDLSKYDDKVDRFIPENSQKDNVSNKQKLKKGAKGGRYQNNFNRSQKEKLVQPKKEEKKPKKEPLVVHIPNEIAVSELASRLKTTNANVVKTLMILGIMATAAQMIDFDTASLVAEELGAKVEKEIILTIEDKLIDETQDKEEDLMPRSPIVVVMGHVDHGKTSLLDAIRNTNVIEKEAGGITQHIGAYRVNLNGRKITFLDTPGHEAFTAMRMRGAQVTDIAILVVAADDGIMPQTVEAINHAKAANVSIIVAINKIDKEGANPDKVMQELTEHGLVPEAWGGDVICVPVSAKKHQNIDELLEMVLLVADMKELKANPNRKAKGVVIEAKLDKGRGPVATVLVQNGTLRTGDIIIAGTCVGRVRAMTNEHGKNVKKAGPAVPVEIIGLSEVPGAGDTFNAVSDEKMARQLAQQRKFNEKQEQFTVANKASLDDLFDQIKQGVKDFNIIVKADVQGSAQAVKQSLEKLSNEEVRVNVIHAAAGGITESDIMLATASNAVVIGFNVRPDAGARDSAAHNEVDIRLYRVIYDCIEEMEAAMKGMLAPKYKETVTGSAEIRQVFKITGVGAVAGTYVLNGKILRNSKVRLLRDSVIIFEGELSSLKRFKDDVKEVASGFECGMSIENYNDLKEGDIIEAYIMEEIQQ